VYLFEAWGVGIVTDGQNPRSLFLHAPQFGVGVGERVEGPFQRAESDRSDAGNTLEGDPVLEFAIVHGAILAAENGDLEVWR
jgi:hypothetical protein